MLCYDYEWDLSASRILMDSGLDVTDLGWQEGDYFRLTYRNGHVVLVKVDPLEKFLNDGTKSNGNSN